MKKFLCIVMIFITFQCVYGQIDCVIQPGDYCRPIPESMNVRSSPEIANNIILNTQGKLIGFYLIDQDIFNGFIHVLVRDFNAKDSASGIIAKGWVSLNLIKFVPGITIYVEQSESSVWNNQILNMEMLKEDNRCIYDPDTHADLLFRRGKARAREGDYRGSIADLSQSIRLWTPSKSEFKLLSLMHRSFVKFNSADYYGALEDLNFLLSEPSRLEQFPFHPGDYFQILFTRGQCYLMVGWNNKALEAMNKVLSIDPQYAPGYYIRGQVRYNLGDRQGCCKDLSKAYDLGVEEAYDLLRKTCK